MTLTIITLAPFQCLESPNGTQGTFAQSVRQLLSLLDGGPPASLSSLEPVGIFLLQTVLMCRLPDDSYDGHGMAFAPQCRSLERTLQLVR